jgi:hypothetical protein
LANLFYFLFSFIFQFSEHYAGLGLQYKDYTQTKDCSQIKETFNKFLGLRMLDPPFFPPSTSLKTSFFSPFQAILSTFCFFLFKKQKPRNLFFSQPLAERNRSIFKLSEGKNKCTTHYIYPIEDYKTDMEMQELRSERKVVI